MGINLNELEQEYNELNSLETLNQDQQDRKNWLENTIGEFKATQQEREQKQLVTIGAATSVDILSQMFDALLPDSKYKSVLGINEYESKSQDFKQMIQAYISETVAKVYEENDQEIVQKDEKIRLLMGQGQLIQVQLDDVREQLRITNVTLEQKHQDYLDAETTADKLRNELRAEQQKREEQSANSAQLMGSLAAQIEELQAKLESAQKPKEESKPSESLKNMLSTIKSKNELNADDMVARWNSRQKSDEAKIQVPDLPSAVLPFQGEDGANPATDVGNAQLPSAQVDETVGPQFPSAPNVGTVQPPDLATGNVSGESTDEQVAAKTESERIAELERRVEALEGKVA